MREYSTLKGKKSVGIDTNNILSLHIPCTCVLGTFRTKESHATYRIGLAKIASSDFVVSFLCGHCPNSFNPPPPSVKREKMEKKGF